MPPSLRNEVNHMAHVRVLAGGSMCLIVELANVSVHIHSYHSVALVDCCNHIQHQTALEPALTTLPPFTTQWIDRKAHSRCLDHYYDALGYRPDHYIHLISCFGTKLMLT